MCQLSSSSGARPRPEGGRGSGTAPCCSSAWSERNALPRRSPSSVTTWRSRRRRSAVSLEIVRLGIPRLGTWRKQEQGFYEKIIWPPMAIRIGLLRSSPLQNDGLMSPSFCSAELLRTPIHKGPWGPIYFTIKSLFSLPPCTQSWYTQSYGRLGVPSLGILSLCTHSYGRLCTQSYGRHLRWLSSPLTFANLISWIWCFFVLGCCWASGGLLGSPAWVPKPRPEP